ncbi:DUF2550 domain-containing protein [Nakamurella leprariae]|uniref:DUF2550 domain-containing protein n=1 Tax=Nakamurella leprariae TaxID=2803911 RepID=A0A938YC47_9ACTN|nr:DUF2550 domain-containing protein [Nakamurella leprariae]MBM9465772.1 DUF2550 domain-containing protein [Nakamurella leprariae]
MIKTVDMGTLGTIAGLTVLILVVIWIVVVAIRRSWLLRSGAIDVCWRGDLTRSGRGWSLGQGRFDGDRWLLYRSFSPLPTASKVLRRGRLELGAQRSPVGAEPDLLPVDSVIVRCCEDGADIELALAEQALTGVRSWIESAPTTSPAHGRSPGPRDPER